MSTIYVCIIYFDINNKIEMYMKFNSKFLYNYFSYIIYLYKIIIICNNSYTIMHIYINIFAY